MPRLNDFCEGWNTLLRKANIIPLANDIVSFTNNIEKSLQDTSETETNDELKIMEERELEDDWTLNNVNNLQNSLDQVNLKKQSEISSTQEGEKSKFFDQCSPLKSLLSDTLDKKERQCLYTDASKYLNQEQEALDRYDFELTCSLLKQADDNLKKAKEFLHTREDKLYNHMTVKAESLRESVDKVKEYKEAPSWFTVYEESVDGGDCNSVCSSTTKKDFYDDTITINENEDKEPAETFFYPNSLKNSFKNPVKIFFDINYETPFYLNHWENRFEDLRKATNSVSENSKSGNLLLLDSVVTIYSPKQPNI